jgi:hypothetical protein
LFAFVVEIIFLRSFVMMSNVENIPPAVNAPAVVDAATEEKEKREKPTEKAR